MKVNIKKTPTSIKIVTVEIEAKEKIASPTHMLRAIFFHPRERDESQSSAGAFDLGYTSVLVATMRCENQHRSAQIAFIKKLRVRVDGVK
jgi:hypothetical protein